MFYSGEEEIILTRGRFIGSLNGKSRLYLSSDGELKIQYYTPTCSKMGGSGAQERRMGTYKSEDENKSWEETYGDSLAMYRIKGVDNKNVGKLGYVDENLTYHKYPKSLLEFGDDYYKKDDYISDMGKSGLIKEVTGNPQTCKAECNKLDNCAGFNSKDGKCSLYNDTMYPNNKELDGPYPGAKMFMRQRKVKNHPTCNTRVTPITSDEMDGYPSGNQMNVDRLCSLGIISKRDNVKLKKKNNEIRDLVEKINGKIGSLLKTRADLSGELKETKKSVDKNLEEYEKNYEILQKDVDPDKFNTLTGVFDMSGIASTMEEHKLALAGGASVVLLLVFLYFYRKKRVN